MKFSRFLFLSTLLVTLSWNSKADDFKTLEIGTSLPKSDYKMMDISGKEISLSDVKQKNGLLVIFSCNTCPYVLAWENRYPEIAKECKDKNIGLILVNSNEAQRKSDDSFDAMKRHAKNMNYSFFYTVDTNSELANTFGATRTPHTFLFDAKNKLVYQGGIDDNHRDASAVKKPYLKDALNAVFTNKEVENKVLRSPGCSIKRL
ncbi:MAG: thioredoxin family protein [Calditrichaeota bacterium]|nr:thioredoxin family protein [Calditrichota bacterium]